MIQMSARFTAGHFFLTGIVLVLCIVSGCSHRSSSVETDSSEERLPLTGDITVVVQFMESFPGDGMPEAASSLASTAGGRLHISTEKPDCFRAVCREADNAGLLMMLVVPSGVQFNGTRDHLVIWTDPGGIPVAVNPELSSELFTDSLWENIQVRQQTILELIHFFKPDLVYQIVTERESSLAVTEFWSLNAEAANISVALFCAPEEDTDNRGWAVFTGRGIKNSLLEGIDLPGLVTTIKLISGLNWNDAGHGFPAMQAFYATETE